MSKTDNFPYPTPIPAKIWGVPFGVDPSCWGPQRANRLGYSAVKLFSQNTNVYDHDTSTSQTDRRTDGRTDRQTTCHGNTALRIASRGKNYRPFYFCLENTNRSVSRETCQVGLDSLLSISTI